MGLSWEKSCLALCSIQQEGPPGEALGKGWRRKADRPVKVWLGNLRWSRAMWDQVMRSSGLELEKKPFYLPLMGPSTSLAPWKWKPLEAPGDVSWAKASSYLWWSFVLATGRFPSWWGIAKESRSFEGKGRCLPITARTDQAQSPNEYLRVTRDDLEKG